MANIDIRVQKATGIWQEFSTYKLTKFLRRIKLPKEFIDPVVQKTLQGLHPETTTTEISTVVGNILQALPDSEKYWARYILKPAIRKLGPDGHTFEQYVGQLFKNRGYYVDVSVILRGKCVRHEVDVVANRQDEINIVECKFHNREGTRSDVTIAMYVEARFLDILEGHALGENITTQTVWLGTNTKVTTDAYDYAKCKGMQILNADLPKKDGIMDRCIANGKLMPISVLPMLSPYLNDMFVNKIITLGDFIDMKDKEAFQLNIPNDIVVQAKALAAKITK